MFQRNDRFATVTLAVCAGVTAIAGVATGVAVPAGAAGARGVTASLLPVGASGPTGAVTSTAAPTFLTAAQLPQGARYGTWKASTKRAGLPKPRTFCLAGTMSETNSSWLPFRGSTEAGAQQFVSVSSTEERATALVAKLKTKIQGCYQEWLDLTGPTIYKGKKITASWKRYGTYDLADGLTVWGVFTVPPKPTPPTTHMYAVGREGRTVTVIHLGLNGAATDAPEPQFTATAENALKQLY